MKASIILLLTSLLFTSIVSQAQTNEELIEKYKGDYGIYTKFYQHLTLYFDKGELKAKMTVEREKLLIDEQYAGNFSTESVYHSYFSTLHDLEAATLIPGTKGFKTVKTTNFKEKSSKEDFVFYDDSKETEVSFNNLQKGNRTTIKYLYNYRDVHMMPMFYLQSYLPIDDLKIKLTFPKGVKIDETILGLDSIGIKRTVEENKQNTTITWEARQVPKLKVYGDAPNLNYYIGKLMLVPNAFTDPKSGKVTKYLGSVEDLNEYMFKYVKDINKTTSDDIKQKVALLTKDLKSEDAKAKAIFHWVQENIRYVAFEDSLGGFIPRDANLVFDRKFGDCKDMSSLLKVMCSAAGLDARYVWIGTRDIPYSVKQFPIPSAFNHMIAAVKINKDWKFLDATDNVIPYGAIPYSLQGKEAFISKDDKNYELYKMPFTQTQNTLLSDSSFIKIDQLSLKGNAYLDLKGYRAWELNAILKYKSQQDIEKTFSSFTKRGNNKYIQNNFKHSFDTDDQKSLHINADFELKDYIKSVGDDYFVNMHLSKPFQDGKVDIEKRKAPVFLNYQTALSYVVVLDVPKGYKVSYLPENMKQSFKDVGSISVDYEVKQDKVYMKKVLQFDNTLVPANAFTNYNNMISQLQQAYKESVELSKIK